MGICPAKRPTPELAGLTSILQSKPWGNHSAGSRRIPVTVDTQVIPTPRLWPSSCSAGHPVRAGSASNFGAAACCSGVSVAVRWELSRLRLRPSLVLSFV